MTITSFAGVSPDTITKKGKQALDYISGFTKKLLGGSVGKVVEAFNKQAKKVSALTNALKSTRVRKLINTIADSDELLQIFGTLPIDDFKAAFQARLKGAASSMDGKPKVSAL